MLQGRTEEELLQFISTQLKAREPYYMMANYIIKAPISFINGTITLAEENDIHIANMLYEMIQSTYK